MERKLIGCEINVVADEMAYIVANQNKATVLLDGCILDIEKFQKGSASLVTIARDKMATTDLTSYDFENKATAIGTDTLRGLEYARQYLAEKEDYEGCGLLSTYTIFLLSGRAFEIKAQPLKKEKAPVMTLTDRWIPSKPSPKIKID